MNDPRGENGATKPLLRIGSKVYAAYWPPDDPDREEDPAWYPGVVTSYKISNIPADDRYGHVRYYNIKYDDGDALDRIPDHFVFPAGEYLLHLRFKDKNAGAKNPSWKGVRNITDETSQDTWAYCVGWYVATIDGEEHTFSLLGDALRAYDSSVVQTKGTLTKPSDLNLPENLDSLLKKHWSKAKKLSTKRDRSEMADTVNSSTAENAQSKPKRTATPAAKDENPQREQMLNDGDEDELLGALIYSHSRTAKALKAEAERKESRRHDDVLPTDEGSPRCAVIKSTDTRKTKPHIFSEIGGKPERKRCVFGGCTNVATASNVCDRHGAKQVKTCNHVGCLNRTKQAPTKNGTCIRHGVKTYNKPYRLEGMRKPKCSQEGCANRTFQGGVCRKHSKAYVCSHKDCSSLAVRKNGTCIRHSKGYLPRRLSV